jgi:PAS domain S-box-containing protein
MSGEYVLKDTDFLVSQTDEKGFIRFANEDFCKIAGYTLEELIGEPHNIVRHRDMPRAAFKDLWETVKSGKIWTGYVKNATKNGGYYWVLPPSIRMSGVKTVNAAISRAAAKPHPKRSPKPNVSIKH